MKIWLDDLRKPPEGFVWINTAYEAINLIKSGVVEEISLDHDLGPGYNGMSTGYDVACFIEQYAQEGGKPIKVSIHTDNPMGRKYMEMAINKANKFWSANEY